MLDERDYEAEVKKIVTDAYAEIQTSLNDALDYIHGKITEVMTLADTAAAKGGDVDKIAWLGLHYLNESAQISHHLNRDEREKIRREISRKMLILDKRIEEDPIAAKKREEEIDKLCKEGEPQELAQQIVIDTIFFDHSNDSKLLALQSIHPENAQSLLRSILDFLRGTSWFHQQVSGDDWYALLIFLPEMVERGFITDEQFFEASDFHDGIVLGREQL